MSGTQLPIVFLGPTLPREEAMRLLEADFRPPVELGDVWRALQCDPPAIGLIDGFFDGVPAVWHKEILKALSESVPVFGAASMGALRAAELHPFGMLGVGAIFEAYRSGALEDDDEVALAHGEAAYGYRPLSEPMVNIRATLARAEAEGILDTASHSALLTAAKGRFYAERRWPTLLRTPDVSTDRLEALRAWLPTGHVDQKRADAQEMLRQMRIHIETAIETAQAAAAPTFRFEATSLFQGLVRLEGEGSREGTGLMDELLLDAILSPFPAHLSALLDGDRSAALANLRRDGRYADLLQRHREKQALLASASCLEIPSADALLAWFFEIRLGGWPADLPAFLRGCGWTEEPRLLTLAAGEYLWAFRPPDNA